jgi:hypothetical protein
MAGQFRPPYGIRRKTGQPVAGLWLLDFGAGFWLLDLGKAAR